MTSKARVVGLPLMIATTVTGALILVRRLVLRSNTRILRVVVPEGSGEQ